MTVSTGKKFMISVVTPCFNEVDNVIELHRRIKEVFDQQPDYDYEQIFIDNFSTDGTVELIRNLIAEDSKVRLIANARNFGHIRSPFYGILQSSGDATMLMVSDLQDPPELIPRFLEQWRKGAMVVMGVKSESEESALFFAVRKLFYTFIQRIATVQLPKNFTGFGLYDREVVDVLRKIEDPYPYFRGLLAELGFRSSAITYTQPLRKRGLTKNNFYSLYDMAMLGVTSHSRVPLRLATMFGFAMSALSFIVAVGYIVAKLLFWNNFAMGVAPLLIGFFLFSSILLFFIGILGEYVGAILTQVQRRPLVIERERLGFKDGNRSERPWREMKDVP